MVSLRSVLYACITSSRSRRAAVYLKREINEKEWNASWKKVSGSRWCWRYPSNHLLLHLKWEQCRLENVRLPPTGQQGDYMRFQSICTPKHTHTNKQSNCSCVLCTASHISLWEKTEKCVEETRRNLVVYSVLSQFRGEVKDATEHHLYLTANKSSQSGSATLYFTEH